MAAPELELIGVLLDLGKIPNNVYRRLTPAAFVQTPDAVMLYSYIQQWAKEHELKTPSRDWMRKQFPKVDIPVTSMHRLDELVEKVVDNMLSYNIQRTLQQFDALAKKFGLAKAVEYLHRRSSNLVKYTAHSMTVKKDKAVDEALAAYSRMKRGAGLTGIPWPWEPLNGATGGIFPGEYYVLFGMPKSMKTWLLLKILAGMIFDDSIHIAFLSGELREGKILSRLAAVIAELDANDVRRGMLDPVQEQLYKDLLESLSSRSNLTLLSRDTPIEKLPAIAAEYDVLMVDSAYRLSSEDEKNKGDYWKNLPKISSILDDISHDKGVTVFFTTQLHPRQYKKSGGGISAMAFSMNIAYDADLLIEIVIPKDDTIPERGLRFVARDAKIFPFTVSAIPATDFSMKYTGLPEAEDSVPPKKKKKETPPWLS